MKVKYNIIYISPFTQSGIINWITNTARKLSAFNCKVIHFPDSYESIPLKKLVTNDNFKNIIKCIYTAVTKNYADWLWFEIIPFRRFRIVNDLNYKLNILVLRLILNNKSKIIIITSSTSKRAIRLIKTVRPDLAIGDCTDFWALNHTASLSKHVDFFLANSISNYERIRKYRDTHLIASGYFTNKFISFLEKKKLQASSDMSILFIGTISWRLDFNLIKFLIDRLPNTKFIFLGTEIFDYTHLNKGSRVMYLDKFAKIKWEKLKLKSNCYYYPIKKQSDIIKEDIPKSVGIIPYNMNYLFNKYSHPIKFYLYTALGLPVVSKKIDSIYNHRSKYIKFTNDSNQFLRFINKFLSIPIPQSFRNKYLEAAYKQTYEAKSYQIIKHINTRLYRPT